MKLPQFFKKPNKPKLLLRRVVGASMLPTFRQGEIVVGSTNVADVQVGDVVMVEHDGLEKIKRVADVRPGEVYVLGDNPSASSDSRSFGWLSQGSVKAKIIWSRFLGR
ncbi:MAG: S24/S26 family peptidase [Candidatus Saccharimonadales bacterium]